MIKTNRPEGGGSASITCLATDDLNVYAGALNGGVFLSTNNGIQWTEVNTGITEPYVYSLTFCDSNIFAGTFGGHIFRSTNNGGNWTGVNTGLPGAPIRSLAVNGSNIFAGSEDGVFLSTDMGAYWTAVNTGLADYGLIIYTFAISDSNIFTGTADGVWRRRLSELALDIDNSNYHTRYFILQQNFPNPFNPSTTIKYSIPAPGKVSLIVYNIFGQHVRTLVNDQKDIGNYDVTWDGKDN